MGGLFCRMVRLAMVFGWVGLGVGGDLLCIFYYWLLGMFFIVSA